MAYTVSDNFAKGIDRRRPIYATTPGSVWEATNCHVSRGGDIEKRKSMKKIAALPPQCNGIIGAESTIYTFGSDAEPAGIPSGFTYMRCQHPSVPSTPMVGVVSSSLYDGKPYCAAKFADNQVFHYYNGELNNDMMNAGQANKPLMVGSTVYTFRNKIYTLAGSLLEYSGIGKPLGWTDGTDSGTGYINMSTQSGGSSKLTGIDVFQGNLAIFSERAIQVWNIKEDETQNYQMQTLKNTGTISPRSVLAYGDIDVFYLDYTGIRTIRARVPSNAAFVNDLGTPIDTYIREWRKTLAEQAVESAISIIEPLDARLWMIIGSRAFVLSYFPASQISAWTAYELIDDSGTQFECLDATTYYERLYLLGADKSLYLLGGNSGDEYDSTVATVQLPFIYSSKPDTDKLVSGIDISSEGDWDVSMLVDPRNLSRSVNIGTLSGVTTNDLGAAGFADTTHIAPKLINRSSGYASLSQVMVTFQGTSEKGA